MPFQSVSTGVTCFATGQQHWLDFLDVRSDLSCYCAKPNIHASLFTLVLAQTIIHHARRNITDTRGQSKGNASFLANRDVSSTKSDWHSEYPDASSRTKTVTHTLAKSFAYAPPMLRRMEVEPLGKSPAR